jgi:hypothetical protein
MYDPILSLFIHGTAVLRSLLVLFFAGLLGCASAPYHYLPIESIDLESSASTQTEGKVTVTVAVPGREQAGSIFGFPIYDRGIQPVWLSISNKGSRRIRYAHTGSDRDYFSPFEVAFMHRKGYSKQSRREMERRLFDLAMPRYIGAGETASGFVFTHVDPGTKNLLVDVFSGGDEDHSFAFLLEVPGFVPDHAEVDFDDLYQPSELRDFDAAGFRSFLSGFPCCTSNHVGQPNGLPVAVVLVGHGNEIQQALLRAGWYETEWTSLRTGFDTAKAHYLFGRQPDAVFRFKRQGGMVRNELNIWLSPWLLEGEPVWMVRITHIIGRQNALPLASFGAGFDRRPKFPDAKPVVFPEPDASCLA